METLFLILAGVFLLSLVLSAFAYENKLLVLIQVTNYIILICIVVFVVVYLINLIFYHQWNL